MNVQRNVFVVGPQITDKFDVGVICNSQTTAYGKLLWVLNQDDNDLAFK
jgi:hypothetical protein